MTTYSKVLKVLIVEDDEDLLFLLGKVLNRAGYDVKCLNEGSSIISNTCEWPDLFILDKGIKIIDGISICKYLKLREETNQIPIVLISGAEYLQDMAIEAGADYFIQKPLNMDNLIKIVQGLITQSKISNKGRPLNLSEDVY